MTKIILSVGAASLLAMSAASFAEQQLTGAQMDNVTAGFSWADAGAISVGHFAATSTQTSAGEIALGNVSAHGVSWPVKASGAESRSTAVNAGGFANSDAAAGGIGVFPSSYARTGSIAIEGTLAASEGYSAAGALFGAVGSTSSSQAALP